MTVIEELVVLLGLDPTKFVEGQKAALEQNKKFGEGVEKQSKANAASLKTVEDGFGKITKAIGEMTAGYLTVTGISSFIQQTNATNVAVGQLATTLGILPSRLAAYEEAARRANINPQSMTSALRGLSQKAGAVAQGDAGIFDPLSRLGVDPRLVDAADPMVLLRGIASAAQKQLAGGVKQNEVNANLAALGLNQEMIYLIDRRDKGLEEFLATSIKFNATTNDQIDASNRLLSIWNNFSPTLTKLGNSITKDLDEKLIALSPILKVVDDHMQVFKDLLESIGGLLIGGGIGAAIGAIIGFFVPIPGATAAGALIGGRIGAAVGLATGVGVAASSSDPNLAAAPKGGSNVVAPAAPGSPGASLPTLQADRARIAEELRRDPGLKEEFFRAMAAEDSPGSAGTNIANQAVMETAMNRALVRGTSLRAQLSYYPVRRGFNEAQRAIMEKNLSNVFGGSNAAFGAIDNSSSWLSSKHERTGEFKTTVNYGGNRITGHPGVESFEIPGTHQSASGDRERQRSWYERITRGVNPSAPTGSNAVVPAAPAEEGWGHWLGRHMPSFLSPSSSSTTNNKQSSLSIGNMNFHGVRDMKDVADNIQPFIANRFSAVAADTGYG